MMASDPTIAPRIPSENPSVTAEQLALTRVALLRELEASLLGSRKALLALDLACIEQGTRDQVGLIRALDAAGGLRAWPPEMAAEVRRCEVEVLQAARLQGALLARARRKLRILANMLAGPSLSYGALFAKSGPSMGISSGKGDREI